MRCFSVVTWKMASLLLGPKLTKSYTRCVIFKMDEFWWRWTNWPWKICHISKIASDRRDHAFYLVIHLIHLDAINLRSISKMMHLMCTEFSLFRRRIQFATAKFKMSMSFAQMMLTLCTQLNYCKNGAAPVCDRKRLLERKRQKPFFLKKKY